MAAGRRQTEDDSAGWPRSPPSLTSPFDVQAAAQAPTVAVEFLEHRSCPARSDTAGVRQLYEVVDRDRLFIIVSATQRDRLRNGLERGAVGRLVRLDLDLAHGLGRTGCRWGVLPGSGEPGER